MRINLKWCRHIVQSGGVGVLLVGSLAAQSEVFVPSNDVSFRIASDQTVYGVGEEIPLKYSIKNISYHSLYVPREWEASCPANPHVWAWFEDNTGKHFVPGFGGSCSPSTAPKTIGERMSKEAVLLKPGDVFLGTLQLDSKLFGGLKPGKYRIEATLYGWDEKQFSDAERSELAGMGSPFMRGEAPDSIKITLTPGTSIR